MILKSLGIALVFVLLLVSPVRAAQSAASGDIAQQLICQCGCTLTLANCSHGECMSRDAMNTLIEQKLSQGQSEKQVIAFFVAQYGEQVLASPPKRGFNLVAWIAPFVAILAGAAIIIFAMREWVKRGSQAPTTTTTESEPGEEKYRQQVEQELDEFRERGFR
ncbi:MAG: cytochrome c-type biogenesis protein CcmH [Chloroflexi bacterium]|nr:cytochrome c-type biogenesis protein CcmH [Chloroflexota bacterium]